MRITSAILALICAGCGPQAPHAVSIPVPDGGTIRADVYGAGERAVVLAHGGRFDRSSWGAQARVLEKAGWRVVAIDLRASVLSRSGEETGCLYDASCLAVDVLAAVRYVRGSGAETVAVVGASLGGGAAAQASVEASPGEIDRLVLLAHMPIASPERMQGRVLFIVARDDPGPGGTPRLATVREQYEKVRGPKSLVVLDGSAHAQLIFETPGGGHAMDEILEFLSAP